MKKKEFRLILAAPHWAFPNIGDDGIDWAKMKHNLESKGDYRAAQRVELKIVVMEDPDMFYPVRGE